MLEDVGPVRGQETLRNEALDARARLAKVLLLDDPMLMEQRDQRVLRVGDLGGNTHHRARDGHFHTREERLAKA